MSLPLKWQRVLCLLFSFYIYSLLYIINNNNFASSIQSDIPYVISSNPDNELNTMIAAYKTENSNIFHVLNISTTNLHFIYSLPKLIHFVCITNDINNNNELNQQHQKNIDSFRKLYANKSNDDKWIIIIWKNENVRNIFCDRNKSGYYYQEQCEVLMNDTLSYEYDITISMKSDVLKYLIMYKFGGMYFDTDFIALKNIENVIITNITDHGLILCNEFEGKSRLISSGFFISTPKHKVIETAHNNIMYRMRLKRLNSNERTGALFWKRALLATYYHNAFLFNKSIDGLLVWFDAKWIATVLPTKYIYSFKYHDNDIRKNEIINSNHPHIYAIHLWNDSWKDKKIKIKINGNENNQVFKTSIAEQYPFRDGWLFDDYKSKTNETFPFPKSIKRLRFPSLLILGFKHKHKTFPLFNPAIIQIDNIANYRKFMLSSISSMSTASAQNIEIINNTTYILIGRWVNAQCIYCHVQSHFHFDSVDDEEMSGSGLILLDADWNILQYVLLQLNYDNNISHVNKTFLSKLEDCRLFNHFSLVMAQCMTYYKLNPPAYRPRNFIGALLWKQDIIDNKHQIIAYLETKSIDTMNLIDSNYANLLKTRQLKHKPDDMKTFGGAPKNLIPFQYNNKLYFEWELKYLYFISVNLLNDTNNGVIKGNYLYHNNNTFSFDNNIQSVSHLKHSYHQSCGYIHLSESNEYLAIAHIHYDLYDFMKVWNPFGIQQGHHYLHFFYTINDKPPFYVKRISEQFCFTSTYSLKNNKRDCEIIQFVTSMIENTIDDVKYLFISYGINDCIGSIVKIKINDVIAMLKPATYH